MQQIWVYSDKFEATSVSKKCVINAWNKCSILEYLWKMRLVRTKTDVSEKTKCFSEEPCSSVASLAGVPPLSWKMVHFLFKN